MGFTLQVKHIYALLTLDSISDSNGCTSYHVLSTYFFLTYRNLS